MSLGSGTIELMSDQRLNVIREVQQTADAFAPLGWAVYGRWHRQESQRIRLLLERGFDLAQIDAAISDVWNGEQLVLLRHVAGPLGRYGRGVDLEFQRRCQQRQTLINEAVSCHEDARYAAAIALTLTQIDGLTREIVGTTFFKANPGKTESNYTDDTTLAGVEGNLPVVRAAFSAPIDKVGRYGLVSRHGVIHGQDLSFATKINSTKTLVLVGALVEHLESRAGVQAEKWRSARDLAKSKLHGNDEIGRLHDDRGLEELYMFRIEFESAVYQRNVFDHDTSKILLSKRANELLKERRLSQRRFTLATVEDDRVMWTFRSPGGQCLGSAVYIPDPAVRPVGQLRWTWDAKNEPEFPPWENEEGWTVAVDEPTTANWAFKGFYTG